MNGFLFLLHFVFSFIFEKSAKENNFVFDSVQNYLKKINKQHNKQIHKQNREKELK